MKRNKFAEIVAFCTLAFFLTVFIPLVCFADSAEVLPKGVFYSNATYYHYFNITKRYNPDGDTEPLATDFNTDLNSNVFPQLAPLDPFVGGTASIGHSEVDFSLSIRTLEFHLYYGITDKLSVGIMIPYDFLKNKVNANLDNSTANVGKNPCFGNQSNPVCLAVLDPNTGLRLNQLQFIPLQPFFPGAPGGIPLNTEDVQNLLGGGLDVNNDGVIDIEGYGYRPVETWSDSRIGDIEVLSKYQFYKGNDWRLAFVGGVRLPTGEVDDPDNLVDISSGDGQTDLLFRLHADYIGVKNLLLNATARYDLQLPDHQELRILENVNQPLTKNKETVKRDLGDIIECELMGTYNFTNEFSGGLKYRYTKRFKDDVEDGNGDITSLEEETDPTGHMFFISLGYSTVQKYLDKKFAVPFSFNLEYRNRFAGNNNLNDSQYISTSLTVFF